MFGSKRRCNDQLSKHGTQRNVSQHASHIITSQFFHVNIREVNREKSSYLLSESHTCEMYHKISIHNECLQCARCTDYNLASVRTKQSYFAFLTFKSFSSCPRPLRFRFNFIFSAFLEVAALTPFLTETNFCLLSSC